MKHPTRRRVLSLLLSLLLALSLAPTALLEGEEAPSGVTGIVLSGQGFHDNAITMERSGGDGYRLEVTLEPEGDSPRMERRQGVCPKFKKVVDGTTYDSRKATPICHRWLSDGGLQELYQNEEGRHFIANLTTWPQIEVTILPCTDDEAKDFSGICG